MIICRNHRPPYPQFESDMLVAAYSVRHSGAVCVAAARRVPGACRGFGFPEPRACRAGLSIGCGWFMGTPTASRPRAVRRAADSWRFCMVVIIAVLNCRTGLLSIVVCG